MTSKTKRTLALMEALGGEPTEYAAPTLLVPHVAWSFYEAHLPFDYRDWRNVSWGTTKLVFRLLY